MVNRDEGALKKQYNTPLVVGLLFLLLLLIIDTTALRTLHTLTYHFNKFLCFPHNSALSKKSKSNNMLTSKLPKHYGHRESPAPEHSIVGCSLV